MDSLTKILAIQPTPILDKRSTADIYQQTLTLAQVYCPEWSSYWPKDLTSLDQTQDPGLVLLQLFANLSAYLISQINRIPRQRQLAFYQFMNMALRPPIPAEVPLTFILKADQPNILIPVGTQVKSKINAKLIYQTQQSLDLIPATINTALTIIPDQDQFIDSTQDIYLYKTFTIFDEDKEKPGQPLNHWLLLGDDDLFTPNSALQTLTIILAGINLDPLYFAQWFDGNGYPLTTEITANQLQTNLTIKFTTLPSANKLDLQIAIKNIVGEHAQVGIKAKTDAAIKDKEYWLAVKPAFNMKILVSQQDNLPNINAVNCLITANAIQANYAVCNNVLSNVKNGIYPFSRTPKLEYSFYIGSQEVFNKTGAKVVINFTVKPITQKINVKLVWEYWNGKQWQSFNASSAEISQHQFQDNTKNFTQNSLDGSPAYISFVCPIIVNYIIAGKSSYWIRVRLIEGDYGQQWTFNPVSIEQAIEQIPEKILKEDLKQPIINYLSNTEKLNFAYGVDNTEVTPPYIQNLTINYSYSRSPKQYWTHNNFVTAELTSLPYLPVQNNAPCFYLGFDPNNFIQYSLNKKFSLFFNLKDLLSKYVNTDFYNQGITITWQYYDGNIWKNLQLEDNTFGLKISGIVAFVVPSDLKAVNLFSKTLCWIKLNNHSNHKTVVKLAGIYPNTVMAKNYVTYINEILGSSNGDLFQQFQLNYSMVLPGAIIGVLEYGNTLQFEKNKPTNVIDDISLVTNDIRLQTSEKIFVQWKEVENFAFSSPSDRHYTLDNQNGIVTFGDGKNGMIPPQAQNNIIAKQYQATAGLVGDSPALTITELKSKIPNVTQVFNPIYAAGGQDGDTINSIIIRSPHEIQNNNRAITAEDLVWLTINATPAVIRAAINSHWDSNILVYILINSRVNRPLPSFQQIQEIQDYLRKRVLVSLRTKIHVVSPKYVKIDLTIQLIITTDSQINQAKQELIKKLEEYLHPVIGNTDNKGWNFGSLLSSTAISMFLLKQICVSSVNSIYFNKQAFGQIKLADNELPCCGKITLLVFQS